MRHLLVATLALVLLVAATWGLREAHAAPETFNTALPVGRGDFVFREQFLYIKASDDPSPADRNLEVLGGISVLGYGATSDLALFGVLPYLHAVTYAEDKGEKITKAIEVRPAKP